MIKSQDDLNRPEPEMTWEELCDLIKDKIERGYLNTWFDVNIGEAEATFYHSGEIMIEGAVVAKNKTPYQMKAIIEALKE